MPNRRAWRPEYPSTHDSSSPPRPYNAWSPTFVPAPRNCGSSRASLICRVSNTFAFKTWRDRVTQFSILVKTKPPGVFFIPAVHHKLIYRNVIGLALRDKLGDEVGAQAFDAAFAAVAAFLNTAERRLRCRDRDRVDADHAGFQRIAYGRCGRVRRGESGGRKPELQ